jgi:hypothetical protein
MALDIGRQDDRGWKAAPTEKLKTPASIPARLPLGERPVAAKPVNCEEGAERIGYFRIFSIDRQPPRNQAAETVCGKPR